MLQRNDIIGIEEHGLVHRPQQRVRQRRPYAYPLGAGPSGKIMGQMLVASGAAHFNAAHPVARVVKATVQQTQRYTPELL